MCGVGCLSSAACTSTVALSHESHGATSMVRGERVRHTLRELRRVGHNARPKTHIADGHFVTPEAHVITCMRTTPDVLPPQADTRPKRVGKQAHYEAVWSWRKRVSAGR
jgi:hypothetical protein